jgi:hypothetical protein
MIISNIIYVIFRATFTSSIRNEQKVALFHWVSQIIYIIKNHKYISKNGMRFAFC